MKIHFTYSSEPKEGFDLHSPDVFADLQNDSVDEISADCAHQVPDLIKFIDECYRVLKLDAKVILTCPHFTSMKAWISPLTKRALCEGSLNFCSKDWREKTKYTEATVLSNFEVAGDFAVADMAQLRSAETKGFWLQRYNNVIEALVLTLTKKT